MHTHNACMTRWEWNAIEHDSLAWHKPAGYQRKHPSLPGRENGGAGGLLRARGDLGGHATSRWLAVRPGLMHLPAPVVLHLLPRLGHPALLATVLVDQVFLRISDHAEVLVLLHGLLVLLLDRLLHHLVVEVVAVALRLHQLVLDILVRLRNERHRRSVAPAAALRRLQRMVLPDLPFQHICQSCLLHPQLPGRGSGLVVKLHPPQIHCSLDAPVLDVLIMLRDSVPLRCTLQRLGLHPKVAGSLSLPWLLPRHLPVRCQVALARFKLLPLLNPGLFASIVIIEDVQVSTVRPGVGGRVRRLDGSCLARDMQHKGANILGQRPV
mmetsp:Transcript_25383/g.64046  ORF Transcript_25383/g.64046 Transcript_25383/m.64046 type:complete len:324 (-) Transcript_25383:992-1963(-)